MGFNPPEPRVELHCLQLSFKILKLVYCVSKWVSCKWAIKWYKTPKLKSRWRTGTCRTKNIQIWWLCLSCPSVSFALQFGYFVPRDCSAAKLPFCRVDWNCCFHAWPHKLPARNITEHKSGFKRLQRLFFLSKSPPLQRSNMAAQQSCNTLQLVYL